MGLMFRVIRKYREEVDTPNYNLDPKKPFISTDNFLNEYFDRYRRDTTSKTCIHFGNPYSLVQTCDVALGQENLNVFRNES